jgi:prophage regulatory protein
MTLLNAADLKRKGITYTNVHLRQLEKEGRFPKRVKPSGSPIGRSAWIEAEIDAYIAARVAERDAA